VKKVISSREFLAVVILVFLGAVTAAVLTSVGLVYLAP
jgi:hypothetical protein